MKKSINMMMLIALFFSGSLHAAIYYVDKNAPPTIFLPDGSSWTRAYVSLQNGLAVAQPGDTLYVADGTYTPDEGTGITPGDRTASFVIPDDVTVLCGFAGNGAPNPNARDMDMYPTYLSGDLNGDDLWGLLNIGENSYHVVSSFGSGSIDGAIIAAGKADGFGDNGYGGGVFMKGSTLEVNHCKIRDNKADYGAGVACIEGFAPVIKNSEIAGNWAYVLGGCLYNDDANIELTNCLITGNTASGAEILGGGDAILNVMGSLDINTCTIADNPGFLLVPNERAIMNFVWGPGFVDTISIKNSIIRNGGNEIWSTEPGIVTLYYNNIEGGTGGYNGIGNIDQDPLFKNPGNVGIEGGWYYDFDGYTLLAGSPSINAGNQSFLPLGLTEDLMGNARVQGGEVDQGAFEGAGGFPPLPPAVVLVPNVVGQTQANAQTALANALLAVGTVTNAYSATVAAGRVISQNPAGGSTANVGSAVDLTISLGPEPGGAWQLRGTSSINLTVSSSPPPFPVTVNGSGSIGFFANMNTEYKIEITATSAAGGNWTVNPATGSVAPGTHTIPYTLQGTNVDLSVLPPGSHKIAEINWYTRPL